MRDLQDDIIQLWLKQKLDPQRLLLGVPAYGISEQLVDLASNGVGRPVVSGQRQKVTLTQVFH